MKANELRIGNCLRYIGHHYLKEERRGKVFRVIPDDIVFLSDTGNVPYVEPIPLTPEILEKCGFVLKDNTFYTKDNIISLAVFDGKLSTTYVCGDNQVNQVKYLHQLQNLYFALTGEELEVKL